MALNTSFNRRNDNIKQTQRKAVRKTNVPTLGDKK